MSLIFEWDARKARANAVKHRVEFPEAATVFADALSVTISNPDHSVIISARRATRHEQRSYEQET